MNTDLITIKTSPAAIDANFEKAESHLKKELKKYDVVVTLETLPGGKQLATELNKTATDIDKKRKEAVAEASAPIKLFDAKMKSLVDLCKNGRVKILEQIKVFEDKTRREVEDLLLDLRAELWRKYDVKEEFTRAEFDDLIILSNITATGSLAKKAKTELEQRVNADKQKQDMIERRLLVLENESYKAGLSAPLTRVHVNSFLFAEDETYSRMLAEMIESEKQRQIVTEEAVRQRTLREQQQDQVKQQPVTAKAAEPASEEKPAYVKPAAPVGQVMHVIQATFEVPVPENIDVSRVVAKLKAVMEDAGITTLKEIKVVA